MRRRGYDVEAMPRERKTDKTRLAQNTNFAWIDRRTGKHPSYIEVGGSTAEAVEKNIREKTKVGQRYTLEFTRYNNTMHILNLEVLSKDKGDLLVVDSQTNKRYHLRELLNKGEEISLESMKMLHVSKCMINPDLTSEMFKMKDDNK